MFTLQNCTIKTILSKKGMLNRLLAYIEVLLPLFRDANWFSSCAYFVSDCHYMFWQLCTKGLIV